MCGIVGFCGGDGFDRADVLDKMKETIVHRGPDSDGSFDDGLCALGFRRLSIIDLEGGDQPIVSDDGRYVIVFNGEIYNYLELREALSREGIGFRTKSDTETILRVYEKYGTKTASMLRGMFAFVIYDSRLGSLYGARDYFGIKPFYYCDTGNGFIFGSEIKSFLPYPSFRKEINPDALKLYLTFQYSPLPETIFKNVFKLSPGTQFTFDVKSGLHTEIFFEATYDPVRRPDNKTAELIDDAVVSSVKYHEIADVEVGAFLSGGVDSSYIVSASRPDKTYSVGFALDGFDECSLAAELCDRLGIKNETKRITADEFFDALPSVQYHSDEPHANLSAVPLYFLAERASRELKVVLSGEGADELFGGYAEYVESGWLRAYKKLPLSFRKKISRSAGKIKNKHLRRFFEQGGKTLEESYIGQAFIMDDDAANGILSEKYRSSVSFTDVTEPIYRSAGNCSDLTRKLYLDMRLWLPYDILLKADKMTMAHSLELRVPYLDKEVFSLARTLTDGQKTRGKITKRVFREAADRKIPRDWAERKKAGFLVPFRVWLRDEKYASRVREVFEKDYAGEFFDTEKLMNMLDEHLSGKKNNARAVYTVYSFLLWYEQFFVLR
ncbi:MAG: asparagine synthase (glutamine-hydrolyzing) [Clostridia bacterium]|nr:asparagine synthase (glutamine-hydrolyzing) [Clostridia bacterium]